MFNFCRYVQNLELAQSLEDVKMEEILHFNLGLVNEKMKQFHQATVHYTVVSPRHLE